MTRNVAALLAVVGLLAGPAAAARSGPAGHVKGPKGHAVALENGHVKHSPADLAKAGAPNLTGMLRKIDRAKALLAKAQARQSAETDPHRKKAAAARVRHLEQQLARLNRELVRLANLRPGQ